MTLRARAVLLALAIFGRWDAPPPPVMTMSTDDEDDGGYHHANYATSYEEFRVWTDHIIERMPGPWLVSAVLVGVLLYATGALIALVFGFLSVYARTRAVYLGSLGVSLVIAAVHWSHKEAHVGYEHARPLFTVSDQEYQRLLRRWFGRLGQPKGVIMVSACFCLANFLLIAAMFLTTTRFRHRFHLEALHPRGFLGGWWASENRAASILILGLFAIVTAFTLGTAARIMVVNLQFLTELRRFHLLPIPTLVRTRLRKITDLYVRVSGLWTMGIFLFVALFYPNRGPVAVVVVGSLFVLGLLTFAVPQVMFRSYIYRSYYRLCGLVLRHVYMQAGVPLNEKVLDAWDVIEGRSDLLPSSWSDLAQLTERPRMWVYDARDIVLGLGTNAAVAIVVFLLQHNMSGSH